MTTRFAHIRLTGRAYPGQVLAVTFTNKAAREMRERVAAMLGRPHSRRRLRPDRP
jgi:DNA helicase-2/ATP-dependent DNA helicase PcrA